MFEKFRTANNMMKMMKVCGGSMDNPSIADQVAATIIVVPLGFRDSIFRQNKYILSDAAILTLIITLHSIINSQYDKIVADIVKKTYCGIREFYKITHEELELMQKNRFRVFNSNSVLSDINNLDDYIAEAQILFKEEYANNKYVEFSLNSPMTLIGFDKQFQLDMETKAYFVTILPMIKKILKSD